MQADGAELDEQDLPGRQGRLFFAYLATAKGRAVPRDELADVLWGDAVPATWDKALGVLASKLRTALSETGVDATALSAARGCYRLDLPNGTWVDVLAAAAAVREAESLLAAHEPERATVAAALAESVARLPFLPGDDGPWVQAERRELVDVRTRAVTVLAETSLQTDRPADAIRWAEQVIEAEPFRESGYRLLMAAHIASGNRAEALRVYERCRLLLADELGTYPSPETEAIYRELLNTPSSTDTTPDGRPRPEQPESSRTRRRPRLVLGLVVVVVAVAAGLVFALDSSGGRAVQPDSVVRVDPQSLRVTQVAKVGDAPDLIVAAGGFLWVSNWILRDTRFGSIRNGGDHSLWRVDPSTGKAVQVGGGVSPCGLAADPSGNVWVANCFPPGSGQASNVELIDRRTLKFIKRIPVPGGANYFRGIAYGDGSLWVANSPGYGRTIWRIDPGTGAKRATHVTHRLGALGWSDREGDLWSTDFRDGLLTRLHEPTHRTKAITLAAGDEPAWFAFSGDSVWVASWGHFQVVRLYRAGSQHPHVRSISLPVGHLRAPSSVWTVAAGAGAIWATTPRDRALWRIDPGTNRVRRVSLPYDATGVTVHGGEVWVTVRGR